MALTATATKKLQEEICTDEEFQSLYLCLLISLILPYVSPFTTIVKYFGPMTQQLYTMQTDFGWCVIFCQL